jgi:hypothetical protein
VKTNRREIESDGKERSKESIAKKKTDHVYKDSKKRFSDPGSLKAEIGFMFA